MTDPPRPSHVTVHRDWPGLVAVILAIFLGLGWAGAVLLASTPWTNPFTEGGVQLLTGIGGVLSGAVATYLGAQIHAKAQDRAERTREWPSDTRPPNGGH